MYTNNRENKLYRQSERLTDIPMILCRAFSQTKNKIENVWEKSWAFNGSENQIRGNYESLVFCLSIK